MQNTSDYKTEYSENAEKIIKKLDRPQKEALGKKISQICSCPYGYKRLRKPLDGLFRVHVNKHFVLVFAIDHKNKTIDIQNYKHHDKIYKT